MPFDEDTRPTQPDGLTIRRRRRQRGWSRRELLANVARATERETGIPETFPLSLLKGIEEEDESVPYSVICLIASGLDCNPVDLLAKERLERDIPGDRTLH